MILQAYACVFQSKNKIINLKIYIKSNSYARVNGSITATAFHTAMFLISHLSCLYNTYICMFFFKFIQEVRFNFIFH